eukprot:Phypoly_transcript_29110.p1 GENE.Phypoly_transcript_29110~~Phypoly_transcript_29110.p1  ORF type:complete len:125 (+),score=13.86 Phypoly_transcript_29110:65-439(+)
MNAKRTLSGDGENESIPKIARVDLKVEKDETHKRAHTGEGEGDDHTHKRARTDNDGPQISFEDILNLPFFVDWISYEAILALTLVSQSSFKRFSQIVERAYWFIFTEEFNCTYFFQKINKNFLG